MPRGATRCRARAPTALPARRQMPVRRRSGAVAWVSAEARETEVSVDDIVRPTTPPTFVRYSHAVLVVGVALATAEALRSFDLEGFLFVIAVPVAVWLGG